LSNSKSNNVHRTHYSSQLDKSLLGKKVRVAGWVEDSRVVGGIIFLTIRDPRGISQIVYRRQDTQQHIFDRALKVPRQSAVVAEGIVSETRSKDTKMEVKGEDLMILNEAIHPLPLDPTGRVSSSIDVRLDARALDLRSPGVAAIFTVRHHVAQSIRRTFSENGFVEVSTPRLIKAGAEGGATLFSLDYFGNPAFLAQSPQLYKEQLTLALDRVFEISTFFRAEKSATRRHLNEFVSVDMEAAFMDEDDVMRICEDIIVEAYRTVTENCGEQLLLLNVDVKVPEKPFAKMTYADAVESLRKSGLTVNLGDDLTDAMLGTLGRSRPDFFWLTEWPTVLKPFYIEVTQNDPDYTRSFDLMKGPLELASGGMRVSIKEKLQQRLSKLGLDLNSFKHHLSAFDWGMPPHSGWGLGLDRLVMTMLDVRNIKECVLYPRDQFRLVP
jgi:aspartyl-tRNA synthetase